jgi:hypothetical protein
VDLLGLLWECSEKFGEFRSESTEINKFLLGKNDSDKKSADFSNSHFLIPLKTAGSSPSPLLITLSPSNYPHHFNPLDDRQISILFKRQLLSYHFLTRWHCVDVFFDIIDRFYVCSFDWRIFVCHDEAFEVHSSVCGLR